jgi:hypothetical protein
MSAYSPEEQAAYDIGFRIGKSLGATGVEFNAISKKKWTKSYRNQIDELIKENEQLRGQLAAEREKLAEAVEALNQAVFAIPTTHGAFETVKAALARIKEEK